MCSGINQCAAGRQVVGVVEHRYRANGIAGWVENWIASAVSGEKRMVRSRRISFRHPRWHAGLTRFCAAECEHRVLQPGPRLPCAQGIVCWPRRPRFRSVYGVRATMPGILGEPLGRRCRWSGCRSPTSSPPGRHRRHAGRCSRAWPNKASVRPIISVVGWTTGIAPA